MKKLLLATTASLCVATMANADEVTLGLALGFTGPLESFAPPMAAGAELAVSEISGNPFFLDGSGVTMIQGDSTCIDSAAATSLAERMITSDRVNGIVGAMCSGATSAIVTNVAVPNGMVVISPSATSPGLTVIEDNGLFFRTAPSDAAQGVVMAEIIRERGISSVAVTYTNNDYGQGLADSFKTAFEERGGVVTLVAAHEDNRADYSSEIGALASAGGEALVVAGYSDSGGSGIIRASLDTGAFDIFVLPDGMVGQGLIDRFGTEIDGSFGQYPGTDSEGGEIYAQLASSAGFDGTSPFSGEAYDSVALMLLAMQSAGSTAPGDYVNHILNVANAPGEKIMPGELEKALQLLADGVEIDYVGASAVELIGPGESGGRYIEVDFTDGQMVTTSYR